MDYIVGGERRAIVKTNPFPEVKYPSVSLEFPRLGELAVIVFAGVVYFDQRLDHVLPDAILRPGTVRVGVKRVQTDSSENHQPLPRRRVTRFHQRAAERSGQTQCGSLLQELAPADGFSFRPHNAPLAVTS